MQRPYMLACHCGDIRFEVDADLADLIECNCSTDELCFDPDFEMFVPGLGCSVYKIR